MEQRNGILSLFPVKKPILGMIHLKGEGETQIFEKAKNEIKPAIIAIRNIHSELY